MCWGIVFRRVVRKRVLSASLEVCLLARPAGAVDARIHRAPGIPVAKEITLLDPRTCYLVMVDGIAPAQCEESRSFHCSLVPKLLFLFSRAESFACSSDGK